MSLVTGSGRRQIMTLRQGVQPTVTPCVMIRHYRCLNPMHELQHFPYDRVGEIESFYSQRQGQCPTNNISDCRPFKKVVHVLDGQAMNWIADRFNQTGLHYPRIVGNDS